ncbi:hypothetical protein PHSY_006765 [Pseudozyma hubeiensis SY62]|uniref:2-oxoadipate dioxygenase/decarboxylase n=1 Tax=Pseudozyma hubeiensis (strain SY62) TaxID=1305764 RepID=R9PCS2_PSEHS|nr:hypothetical protein PHSY_006765 [Pseudozyma hubeiensis SY62]GAC99166.1 hypothetical protein PHSY_006765 [Pseudozyma hubeiensis SY62]
MYATDSAPRYTFISSLATSSQQNDSAESSPRQQRHRSRTAAERCDVHPSIAQLYLRSSLDALQPRRANNDTTAIVDKKRLRKVNKMVMQNVATASASGSFPPAPTGKSSAALDLSASFEQSQTQTLPALSSTDDSSSSSSSFCSSKCLTSTQMRALLASSMSTMYRSEVPLYGQLLSIIASINSDFIRASPNTISDDEISRLYVERHGAIRVGTAEELSLLARIFKVFGMHPVGYYDLWRDAKLPIHATAFRPVGKENLVKNPFRIFCSLLRMDCIQDGETRGLAEELLGKRSIVPERCINLLVKAEQGQSRDGVREAEVKVDGLTREEALEFVERVVDIFAWHKDTPVSLDEYNLLAKTHPLVADIVSFRGPHINHLTPRTLDIDQVQRTMITSGIDAKDVIEGPPKRENEVYLRQTSFHALSESVEFSGGEGGLVEGKHKARFGEIEARGQALTRKGAALYDSLMDEVSNKKREVEKQRGAKVGKEECVQILRKVFEEGFPDSKDELLRQGLGFFTFSIKDVETARDMWQRQEQDAEALDTLADMIKSKALDAEPITYEDFLPASAAGIFQSNLPQAAVASQQPNEKSVGVQPDKVKDTSEARAMLQAAVGGTILDYFALYSEQQSQSIAEVATLLDIDMSEIAGEIAGRQVA